MTETKRKNIEDFKPFGLVFGKNAFSVELNENKERYLKRNIFYYDRSWFCQENYNIHSSEKQVLNCPHCSKKWFKPESKSKIE